MIDLIQLTDTCGDAVWVNPATVRMVSPIYLGAATVLTFGDEGKEAELTVVEEPPEVVARLTGKPWGKEAQAA